MPKKTVLCREKSVFVATFVHFFTSYLNHRKAGAEVDTRRVSVCDVVCLFYREAGALLQPNAEERQQEARRPKNPGGNKRKKKRKMTNRSHPPSQSPSNNTLMFANPPLYDPLWVMDGDTICPFLVHHLKLHVCSHGCLLRLILKPLTCAA